MTKYQTFFNNLNTTISNIDSIEAKAIIGDSINNNRTLTVNQTIRFLSLNRSTRTLSINLGSIFDLLRTDIKFNRLSNRTDSIDINEFISFYETSIIGAKEYTNTVSNLLV